MRELFGQYFDTEEVALELGGKINLPKLVGTLPPYGDKVNRMLRQMLRK